MALSLNPISASQASALAAANPFAGLPSAAGANSLDAGASLLGGTPTSAASAVGSLPGLSTSLPKVNIGAISAITSKIPSPTFVNPQAKLVAKATEMVSAASIPSVGNIVSKAGLDAKIGQLSGGAGSGFNGMTAGALSGAGATLLGGASSAGGVIDGLGSKVAGVAGGAVNSLTSAASSGIGSLQSLAGSISNVAADISGSLNKLGGGNLAGGIMNALGGVSSAAGMINNILSLKRGVNLPAGGELFKQTSAGTGVDANSTGDWRVRISTNWTLFGKGNPMIEMLEKTGGVVWPYLPNITVSTKANYTQVDTVHSNYPYQAYKNSQVDEIQISGEFSCEIETDAAYWIAATTFFKTATKMFFGTGDQVGNPPIICRLNGYGSSIFNNVPVIVKSFSVDFKDDINYIKCDTFKTSTWVPVLSTITITVMPVYNRANLRQFNLQEYAAGGALNKASGTGYI